MPQPQIIPLADHVNRDDAAAYISERHRLGCTRQYLARLASKGGGPPFRRLNGRWPIYKKSDLDVWAATRVSEPMLRASDRFQTVRKSA